MATYWIIFDDSDHWVKHLFEPGFVHAWVIMEDGDQLYAVNPVKDKFIIELMPKTNHETLEESLSSRYFVIKVEADQLYGRQFMGFKLFSCVSIIKYLIGFKLFCITPYSLYKKLFKLDKKNKLPKGIRSVKFLKCGGMYGC